MAITLFSCNGPVDNTSSTITSAAHYDTFLKAIKNSAPDTNQQLIDSLALVVTANPGFVVDAAKLAALHNARYDTTGDVDALLSFVRFRESTARNTAIKPENSYRLLAQAYIKQHAFKKADSVMKSFTAVYSSPASKMVQYDVAMETGDYAFAKTLLDSLRNTTDYNYLIRAAKYNDYDGNLKNTIQLLEQATAIAQKSGTPAQQLWAYTNLADYYGHYGAIDKSYNHYLKALAIDPTNHYCLKGIAWIAYSYDDKPAEALRILEQLKETHKIPDYDLLMAEVYEYMGNGKKAQAHKRLFLEEVASIKYGGMYNLYKIEQGLAGTKQQQQAALILAQQEMNSRATPETYAYLAQALLVNGQTAQALDIIKNRVAGKTHEPVAALQMAQVYKAYRNNEKLAILKEDLLGTRFEMGPVTYLQIKAL